MYVRYDVQAALYECTGVSKHPHAHPPHTAAAHAAASARPRPLTAAAREQAPSTALSAGTFLIWQPGSHALGARTRMRPARARTRTRVQRCAAVRA